MKLKRSLALLTAASAATIAALASCTSSSSPTIACGPDSVAATDFDVALAIDDESAFYFAAVDPVPVNFFTFSSTDMPLVTFFDPASAGVAAAVGNNFPSGCATASANGNVVTFVLTNCSGPLDLLSASGTFTATFTATGNGTRFGVALAGSNMVRTGATLNLNTSANVTIAANGQKTLTAATSQTTGTGQLGNPITHMGTYTLVWPTGTGCATLNANLSGIGTGSFSGTTTTITNYVACQGKCPQSGTSVSNFNGGTVTLSFNGSNTAQCSASNGTTASIALRCP